MKTSARLALLLVAGLTLAGCTSKTALNQPPAPAIATARSGEPQSARDHFMMRDIEDKLDRQFGRDR
jgi:predicted small lipoprotein YifL